MIEEQEAKQDKGKLTFGFIYTLSYPIDTCNLNTLRTASPPS